MAWFTDRHFFLLAVIFYGLSSAYSVFLWRKGFRTADRVNYMLLLAAAVLHTTAMVLRGFNLHECPVNNLYEATSFIAWTIVAAYLVIGAFRKLRFLGAFASHILLFMGVFALMPALDPPHAAQPDFSHGLTSLHATLVLLAIGAFVMQVAVQGAWGVIPVHLNELSPGAVRATLPGFIYQAGNLAASYGGPYQAGIAESAGGSYGYALALFAGVVAVCIIVAAFLWRGAHSG